MEEREEDLLFPIITCIHDRFFPMIQWYNNRLGFIFYLVLVKLTFFQYLCIYSSTYLQQLRAPLTLRKRFDLFFQSLQTCMIYFFPRFSGIIIGQVLIFFIQYVLNRFFFNICTYEEVYIYGHLGFSFERKGFNLFIFLYLHKCMVDFFPRFSGIIIGWVLIFLFNTC